MNVAAGPSRLASDHEAVGVEVALEGEEGRNCTPYWRGKETREGLSSGEAIEKVEQVTVKVDGGIVRDSEKGVNDEVAAKDVGQVVDAMRVVAGVIVVTTVVLTVNVVVLDVNVVEGSVSGVKVVTGVVGAFVQVGFVLREVVWFVLEVVGEESR